MTTTKSGVTITMSKIPLLTEEAGNWITWKSCIEAKLGSLQAKNIVLGNEPHPPPHTTNPALSPANNQTKEAATLTAQANWDEWDAKAFNLIVENIDNNHLSLFKDPPIDSSSHLAYDHLLMKYTNTLSGVNAFYTKMELVEHEYMITIYSGDNVYSSVLQSTPEGGGMLPWL